MNAKKFKRLTDQRKVRIVHIYDQKITEEGQTIIKCKIISAK